MHINPVTLCFSGPDSHLEPGFQKHFFRLSLPVFRWGFALGIFLFTIFGALDAVVFPNVKNELWTIRFMVLVPLMAGGILFSFCSCFERFWQPTISFLVIVCAAGILLMILIAPPPYNVTYYAGIMLVAFFYFALIRARFVWSCFTGAVMLLLFEFSFYLQPVPFPVLISTNFFFCTSAIIGLMACYFMEYYARENYFLMVQVDEERTKYAELSEELKRHIADLKQAKSEINMLSGLLPICANCKKIREDSGYWTQMEKYISEHSEVVFSHALCPECMESLYGGEDWYRNDQ